MRMYEHLGRIHEAITAFSKAPDWADLTGDQAEIVAQNGVRPMTSEAHRRTGASALRSSSRQREGCTIICLLAFMRS